METEKKSEIAVCPSDSPGQTEIDVGILQKPEDEEVFGSGGEGQVNFRTVGWIRASLFLMKQTFATGVLSIPSASK